MREIIKREIKNYLKNPLFWIGVMLVLFGVYQQLRPYLMIRYETSDQELKERFKDNPEIFRNGDIADGYVPSKEEERRQLWEDIIKEDLINVFALSQSEAEAAVEKIHDLSPEDANAYLEEEYHYFNSYYTYEDTRFHKGTKEEMNSYIENMLSRHSFSYYFSRKFADFAGLFMAFFAAIMLSVLFWQDTRKNTYELLHTKPTGAASYVLGKVAGGFLVSLTVLAILNLVFWAACVIFTKNSGFEVKLTDFLLSSAMYIVPNMLMIVCVYALISLVFKSPLPAVPFLFLYMVYSNMGRRNEEGIFGYYGQPLAIMVRFPGNFFDTTPPPLAALNQSFLILASIATCFLCVQLWKRRRM